MKNGSEVLRLKSLEEYTMRASSRQHNFRIFKPQNLITSEPHNLFPPPPSQ